MKKTKVIIPALGLLVLSTAASISGTVAWFSVNSTVSVSGMTVETKVASSVLIAGDTIDSTAKKADNLFDNGPLSQVVSGILEPVSTVDARQFYYTTNALANGDAKTDAYTLYSSQAAFATAYGQTGVETVLPYVDYVFQLKVSNTGANVESLNLAYTPEGEEVDSNKAFRVAFFVENITSSNPTGTLAVSTGSANGIYAPATAANFSDAGGHNFAVSGSAAVTQMANDYNALTKLAEVPVATASVPASYYKVIARLYIEGEDTTCKNDTFALLNGDWALTMDITLGTNTSNVSALTLA